MCDERVLPGYHWRAVWKQGILFYKCAFFRVGVARSCYWNSPADRYRRSHDAKMPWTARYFRQYCSCWQGLWFMGKPWIYREPWRWFLHPTKVKLSWSVVHRFLSLQRKASCRMLFHEDQRPSQNRHALRKARLQIPRFHSFGGYSALACIISPADDFGNAL